MEQVHFTLNRDQLRYIDDHPTHGMIFHIRLNLHYSELLGSRIGLGYDFQNPDVKRTGPSISDLVPTEVPSLLKKLKAVHLYLNGKYVEQILKVSESGVKIAGPTSQWDFENNYFTASMGEFKLIREVVARLYENEE